MKTYHGRNGHDVTIVQDGRVIGDLPLRLDLQNHSPDGFSWGYGGSGPAQLALALLAEHFRERPGGDARALGLYQGFKWSVIAILPSEWVMSSDDIEAAISAIKGVKLKADG